MPLPLTFLNFCTAAHEVQRFIYHRKILVRIPRWYIPWIPPTPIRSINARTPEDTVWWPYLLLFSTKFSSAFLHSSFQFSLAHLPICTNVFYIFIYVLIPSTNFKSNILYTLYCFLYLFTIHAQAMCANIRSYFVRTCFGQSYFLRWGRDSSMCTRNFTIIVVTITRKV